MGINLHLINVSLLQRRLAFRGCSQHEPQRLPRGAEDLVWVSDLLQRERRREIHSRVLRKSEGDSRLRCQRQGGGHQDEDESTILPPPRAQGKEIDSNPKEIMYLIFNIF